VTPSDEELVRRAATAEGRNAFAMLVSRHQSDVRNTLRRLTRGDAARADDLAQEAFVKAWRSIGEFRGEASFRTWMFRIAYRTFLSEVRRNEPQTEEIGEHHAVGHDDHEGREFMADFDAAMGHLSLPQRDAVHFALQRGFSHPEIAAIMNLPIGTVKTHILRGRARLQEILSHWQEGFEHA
jgi:RNA polymerase sigma-70 factor (ECF subfamily)